MAYPKVYSIVKLELKNPATRKVEIIGYYPEECSLLSEMTEYLPNGESKTKYEVVFDRGQEQIARGIRNFKRAPQMSANGECLNSEIVDFVTDNKSEIVKLAKDLNLKAENERTVKAYKKKFFKF